jgi:hypothetical protein
MLGSIVSARYSILKDRGRARRTAASNQNAGECVNLISLWLDCCYKGAGVHIAKIIFERWNIGLNTGKKGRDPVGNRPKWLLLIRGEGIRVVDLKEKNEKTSSFRPAGISLFNALPC